MGRRAPRVMRQRMPRVMRRRALRRGGFTLIELLVVIAILGIAAGIAVLSVSAGEGRLLREETARLAALFRLAQDEARISGRTLVWEADRAGYAFRALGSDAPLAGSGEPLRARAWPFEVVRLEAAPILFGREPLLEPAALRIATAEGELRLALDAFGNLTPAE